MDYTTRRRALAIVAGGLCAVAIGLSGAAAATSSATISGFAFQPNPIVVTAGDTVTWTNNDAVGHTVTADGGSFNSGTIANGASFSQSFATAGTFAYHCSIHRTMHGSVTIQAAATPPPTRTPRPTPRPTGTRATPPPTDTSTAATPTAPTSWQPVVLFLAAVAGMSLLLVVPLRRR